MEKVSDILVYVTALYRKDSGSLFTTESNSSWKEDDNKLLRL